jgi:hypothetical protein
MPRPLFSHQVVWKQEAPGSGTTGPPGPQGPAGPAGATGPAGPGVPAGGAVGTLLTKNSATDYDTVWTAPGSTIVTDTGPPAALVGATGDYYIDRATDTMYGPKVATGLPGGPEFVCPPGSANGDTTSNLSEGITFTVSRACWLVGANHFVFAGDETTTWWFQLWDMAGSATVPLHRKETAGGLVAGAWAREPLGPYALQSGVTYMLSVTNTAGGRSYVSGISAATSGPLSIIAGGYYNLNTNLDTRPATAWGTYGPATTPVVQDSDPTSVWPIALEASPAGGTAGQVLQKATASDYDVAWTTPAALAYRHVQATAGTVWSITHNLSFRPNVAAVDSTGREIVPGAVDYPSATAVTLTFSAAVGGEAYLS